jgi:hypothetical protein
MSVQLSYGRHGDLHRVHHHTAVEDAVMSNSFSSADGEQTVTLTLGTATLYMTHVQAEQTVHALLDSLRRLDERLVDDATHPLPLALEATGHGDLLKFAANLTTVHARQYIRPEAPDAA